MPWPVGLPASHFIFGLGTAMRVPFGAISIRLKLAGPPSGALPSSNPGLTPIFGPADWGWCAYFYSAADGCAPGADGSALQPPSAMAVATTSAANGAVYRLNRWNGVITWCVPRAVPPSNLDCDAK